MLIAVHSFGSKWTARLRHDNAVPDSPFRVASFYNTTAVGVRGALRNRSVIYGHVRIDGCTGFCPEACHSAIHAVFESDGLCHWNGHVKLFLRRRHPLLFRPDAYLVGIRSATVGLLARDAAWKCDQAQVISFSDAGCEQEALLLMPAFGWALGTRGTFCLVPDFERPWRTTLVSTTEL